MKITEKQLKELEEISDSIRLNSIVDSETITSAGIADKILNIVNDCRQLYQAEKEIYLNKKFNESLLPDFLYEYEGEVKVGVYADSSVTDEWNQWNLKMFAHIEEQINQTNGNIPSICYCTCEKQSKIVTVHPLPDICDYCRKAIKEL